MNSPGVLRRLAADSAYVLAGFPLGIVSFVVLLPAFVLSVALLPLAGLGLFVGVGCLLLARVLADFERFRLPSVLHRAVPRPLYKHPGKKAILTDLQSWLDLIHGIVKFPLSIIGFVLVVTWWALTLGGLTYFLWDWALPHSDTDSGLHELMGFADTTTNRIALHTAIGVVAALTLPLVARGCALLEAGFARAMLTGVAEVRNKIAGLQDQRAAAVSAEATALRKLERDIHDGPQQRLVRLAMDLGRAKQQLDTDPEKARSTLDEALGQTRETLDELRSLSRGIAPPVLTDRGLPGALAALAGRSTVPVDLAVDPSLGERRPRAEVENAAYFVVAEALANAAKHSQARRVEVTVARGAETLGVLVIDDGVGGAHVAKGHGLAGLVDRVRAVGGMLTVSSPAGGPTELKAEVPE